MPSQSVKVNPHAIAQAILDLFEPPTGVSLVANDEHWTNVNKPYAALLLPKLTAKIFPVDNFPPLPETGSNNVIIVPLSCLLHGWKNNSEKTKIVLSATKKAFNQLFDTIPITITLNYADANMLFLGMVENTPPSSLSHLRKDCGVWLGVNMPSLGFETETTNSVPLEYLFTTEQLEIIWSAGQQPD